jgi:3',5'-cyclic-nucleotide phosphodiesterase
MAELRHLAALVDAQRPTQALRGITVLVSHIKPTLQCAQTERAQIMRQVAELNDLGIHFLFPEQGDRITF